MWSENIAIPFIYYFLDSAPHFISADVVSKDYFLPFIFRLDKKGPPKIGGPLTKAYSKKSFNCLDREG